MEFWIQKRKNKLVRSLSETLILANQFFRKKLWKTIVDIIIYTLLHAGNPTFTVYSKYLPCDKSRCKGPMKYYDDLNCIPIYGPEDSCCPIKYNCDHLMGRAEDKCYYKGHVYEIGETLKSEHARPCDIGCFCSAGYNGPAKFTCAVVDCFNRAGPGCYLKKAFDKCCDGPQVCPQDGVEIAKCEVDGKTYLDGQQFTPESDPTKTCICAEGYTGENVAPFCKVKETSYPCAIELRHAYEIQNNCTPAFYSSQNPATDCNYFSRCQNKDDRVVKHEAKTGIESVPDADSTCRFGQLTLNKGDELNSGTDYSSVCLKCVCEIPPMTTCQRLPDDECDVTVHAKFDDF